MKKFSDVKICETVFVNPNDYEISIIRNSIPETVKDLKIFTINNQDDIEFIFNSLKESEEFEFNFSNFKSDQIFNLDDFDFSKCKIIKFEFKELPKELENQEIFCNIDLDLKIDNLFNDKKFETKIDNFDSIKSNNFNVLRDVKIDFCKFMSNFENQEKNEIYINLDCKITNNFYDSKLSMNVIYESGKESFLIKDANTEIIDKETDQVLKNSLKDYEVNFEEIFDYLTRVFQNPIIDFIDKNIIENHFELKIFN